MKTLAIGRNDPCPCGSGKKFKKCCMEKDKSTPSSHGAAEVSGGLREAMEGRQFNSLAEVQAFTDRYTQQRNQRPLDEFQGLSPEQMYHLLYFPFASPELVRFPEVLRTTPAAPMLTLFTLLTEAIGEQGLKPTTKG
ncbi:MAG: SEC-C metal-binding domain-containing protein, partial [Pseudomonadota bacterium]